MRFPLLCVRGARRGWHRAMHGGRPRTRVWGRTPLRGWGEDFVRFVAYEAVSDYVPLLIKGCFAPGSRVLAKRHQCVRELLGHVIAGCHGALSAIHHELRGQGFARSLDGLSAFFGLM